MRVQLPRLKCILDLVSLFFALLFTGCRFEQTDHKRFPDGALLASFVSRYPVPTAVFVMWLGSGNR